MGSQWIEIQEPAPGAIALYQNLGFDFDSRGRLVIAVENEDHRKHAQLMINRGGCMGELIKKPVARKALPKAGQEPETTVLSANQRRFLNVALAGNVEEPSLLAGRPKK